MNLLKTWAVVGGLTLVSRILGFLRDTVIARVFGVGLYSDAFFVAFKITSTIFRVLITDATVPQAVTPILAEYRSQHGPVEARDLVGQIAMVMVLVLIGVVLFGFLAAPAMVYLSAPGFSGEKEKFDLTVHLLRWTLPYVFLVSMAVLVGGVLNTYEVYFVPPLSPMLFNLSVIVCALWLSSYFTPPVIVLGASALLGGMLQLCFQIPSLVKIGMLPRRRPVFLTEGVRRILKLAGPAVMGVSIEHVNLLINTIFASFLVTGSVSWLYYADRLMEFPTGILGVALGSILLPSLAKHYADSSPSEYSRLLDWGMRLTLVLSLPASLALAILSVPLISTLFFYGKFSFHDLWMTREALVAYSIGLVGLIMVKVLAPGFYARQNIRTPVKISLVSLVATQLMNIVFIGYFKHAGLALSLALGTSINSGLLLYYLRRHNIYQPQPGWSGFLLKVTIALLMMGGALWFAMGEKADWLTGGMFIRMTHLIGVVAVGGAVYFSVLALLGVRMKDFAHIFPHGEPTFSARESGQLEN